MSQPREMCPPLTWCQKWDTYHRAGEGFWGCLGQNRAY